MNHLYLKGIWCRFDIDMIGLPQSHEVHKKFEKWDNMRRKDRQGIKRKEGREGLERAFDDFFSKTLYFVLPICVAMWRIDTV